MEVDLWRVTACNNQPSPLDGALDKCLVLSKVGGLGGHKLRFIYHTCGSFPYINVFLLSPSVTFYVLFMQMLLNSPWCSFMYYHCNFD